MSVAISYISDFKRINRSLSIYAEVGGKGTLRVREYDNGEIVKEVVNKDTSELLELHTKMFYLYSQVESVKDELAGD